MSYSLKMNFWTGNDCRNAAGLFPVLEEDQGRKLTGQGRCVDVELHAHVRISADIDFTWNNFIDKVSKKYFSIKAEYVQIIIEFEVLFPFFPTKFWI
jgi:hypothetical protein